MCDGFHGVDLAFGQCRLDLTLASASRVRASGPILPRRVSMNSDTPFTRDWAVANA